jgi:hypothetical protein
LSNHKSVVLVCMDQPIEMIQNIIEGTLLLAP